MIHLAELFFMMFPSKPSCSSGISSPATLTKENRTQISHSFYTRISTVSHFTWLNPPPPQKTTETTEGHPGLRLFGQVLGGSGDISSWSWMDSYCLTVLQFYYGTWALWCSMMFYVHLYVHCSMVCSLLILIRNDGWIYVHCHCCCLVFDWIYAYVSMYVLAI